MKSGEFYLYDTTSINLRVTSLSFYQQYLLFLCCICMVIIYNTPQVNAGSDVVVCVGCHKKKITNIFQIWKIFTNKLFKIQRKWSHCLLFPKCIETSHCQVIYY